MECATSFERRELREPYQRYDNQPRYTLSMEELNGYLAVMGIGSLCVPARWGAPFVNVDWDSQHRPDAMGRLLSIGFENLYHGSGWSAGYIAYATYDFAIGSEYNVFATQDDRDAVREGTMPGMIEIGGVRGFTRFHTTVVFEDTHVYKTYVFPFETYYVTVVYYVSYLSDYDYDPEDVNEVIQRLEAGAYPADQLPDVQAMDYLVRSLQFQPLPPP